MINLKLEVQNYPPIDINDLAENGIDVPDNIRNSITLYNKALDNIKMDSEDIAIIELKKAISMNPTFHEAMNLLGVCYGYIKDYSKASEMFEKVIEAENNSIKALKYLGQINSNDSLYPGQENKRKNKKPEKIKEKQHDENWVKDIFNMSVISKSDIIRYAIGFACGALVIFLFSLPFYSQNKLIDDIKKDDSLKTSVSAVNSKIDDSQLNKLKEDIKNLQDDLQAAKSDVDYYKNSLKLYEIERLAAAKNYETAADKLVLIKTIDFKGVEKEKFNALYGDVMPKAAWYVFNEGYRLMNARKYQDALPKLNKVQIYGDNWAYMDLTLYYIGNCYKEMNDSRNAIAAFQKIKDNYPKSQYIQWADNKIKELTGVP